jgi:hypothetical protein
MKAISLGVTCMCCLPRHRIDIKLVNSLIHESKQGFLIVFRKGKVALLKVIQM